MKMPPEVDFVYKVITAPKNVGVLAGNKKREPSRPFLGAWAAGGVFCGALRLAVASPQGAAGLSPVPVAPPGEAIISAFCARAPRRPLGKNARKSAFSILTMILNSCLF